MLALPRAKTNTWNILACTVQTERFRALESWHPPLNS